MPAQPSAAPAVAAVVGRQGVGKTLFVLRFAQWCGMSRLLVSSGSRASGDEAWVELDPADAVSRLVGSQGPTTRQLQHLEVQWRHAKRWVRIRLSDTVGLTDGIHPDPQLRQAMAESLGAVLESPVVLHVLDGAEVARRPQRLLDEDDMDFQLARYGERRRGYAVIVNKLDLPGGKRGLDAVRQAWPRRIVLGTSAVEGWGFARVRRFVERFV
ncbi:GTPase [Carboxydochorda subterranea]|uniref:GTPase n=1 Tax=Carboxydichorda subterranea TaxID=3109565 RepID=A0ABZ1C0N7_9FIRM|nr:GTPase [Limnochorda sp. L945t]WRP18509.1 GTPase [Limnochorda sp. L945t]